jgi:hypothetical protein
MSTTGLPASVDVTYLAYPQLAMALADAGLTGQAAQQVVSAADHGRVGRIAGDSLTVTLTDDGYRMARVCR